MTAEEVQDALTKGMEVFLHENAKSKIGIVGLGEMGIGNTTSASAIISVVTGITPGLKQREEGPAWMTKPWNARPKFRTLDL